MATSRELWAKLERDKAGTIIGWHSLVDHSADVSAVVLALLDQPTIAQRLARLAGFETLDAVTRARLGALVFFHDIGKANRGFRARADIRLDCRDFPVGHIDQLAWLLLSENAAELGDRVHTVLGLDRIFSWFESDEAYALFDAVFAHHGRPWRREPLIDCQALWRPGADGDPIADLIAVREALDRWFPAAFGPGRALPDRPAFHHAFAGLLMLADWLGSDQQIFGYANGAGPDRFPLARQWASDAVRAVGLQTPSIEIRDKVRGIAFSDAFAGRSPRAMQAATALPQAPLVVLEAETGSGKTEAALWRFKRLLEQGAVDGLYFALPTRVAATAMFERVKAFRDQVFGTTPPIVVLAVPGQATVDQAEGRPLPGFAFEWDDQPDRGLARTRWAAEHPKRFLAAPIAVGTIDQALLGGIRTRHAHLRGFSLLRHLLVVDEVHASDRYMEGLLQGLLRNHVAAGGHALLLSATLGSAARARLLEADCPDPDTAEAIPYPALSWREGNTERRHVPDQARPTEDRQIRIQASPILDAPDAIAAVAREAAARGAKVLVIRNTVGAAVATSLALEAVGGAEDPLLLRVGTVASVHHSRFSVGDRRLLDLAVDRIMGRNRAPGGAVVAGTQTLEISLDLDADLLLTDLCPADVLLQRIGRLHRHAGRDRPEGFAAPRAIVLVPAERSLLPFSGSRSGRHGLGGVYEDLRMIEATWRQIEAAPVWDIPEANRRLVERTTHPAHLEQIGAEMIAADGAAWNEHFQRNEGEGSAGSQGAAAAILDWRQPFRELRIDNDEQFSTRLGSRDRLVELPSDATGPFGIAVGTLRIACHMLKAVPADAQAIDIHSENNTVRFAIGCRRFVYDRHGLATQGS